MVFSIQNPNKPNIQCENSCKTGLLTIAGYAQLSKVTDKEILSLSLKYRNIRNKKLNIIKFLIKKYTKAIIRKHIIKLSSD